MVFSALQDCVGEEKLNGAIKAFLAKTHYQTRPYPNTAGLMAYLKRATPDSVQYVLLDLFGPITLSFTGASGITPLRSAWFRCRFWW